MNKILVIEDRKRDWESFVECFESEGYNVLHAQDGLTGMQVAREWLPDLILCDITLPGLNGFEVLERVRQDTNLATVAFIFLSGRTSRAEIRQGMCLGADDYLTKPCSVEDLLNAISARLSRQSALLQLMDPVRLARTPSIQHLSVSFPQLAEVFRFIASHYREQISLRDVALTVGYSPAYLTNLMQRETGRTVNSWITEYRMAEARSLLLKADLSVNQVATSVGYLDTCHFIRKFRQVHKTTPKAWRDRHLTAGPGSGTLQRAMG
jgi:YesN/AraC family two-component response regulator